MEPNTFELTPKQKGILAALSRETGKPIPALLDEALDVLQAHERHSHAPEEANGSKKTPVASSAPPKPKHIWEIAEELFGEVPEEDFARIPVDGAARHDYYLRHGWPKSSQ